LCPNCTANCYTVCGTNGFPNGVSCRYTNSGTNGGSHSNTVCGTNGDAFSFANIVAIFITIGLPHGCTLCNAHCNSYRITYSSSKRHTYLSPLGGS